jgi:uncharacterized membrane protein YebE (DUF533 family)
MRLAAKIADALCAAGLVLASERADVEQKLSAGTARERDWQGWVERALAGEPPEEADD